MKEVLITSAILIVALILLRLIFAKKVRRKWIYAAWLLVALRLLIPVHIGQVSFSALNSAKPLTQVLADITDKQVAGTTERDAYQQVLQDYIEKDLSTFTPPVQNHIQNALSDHKDKNEIAAMIDKIYTDQEIFVSEVQPLVQQKVTDAAAPITLGQIAIWIWLAGVGIMVLWLATGNLLLGHRLRKNQKPLECDSPIPVYISDAAISPCLVGLFRPAVYLTPECAADETIFRHVLAHELTHYAHKDHIWALVRCICLCVYWFNPLVWIAAWFSRRDCELACDEGAIKRLGEAERIAYGRSLLLVVSQASPSGRLMLTATTMAESKKQLKERVKFIAHKPKWSLIATVCMMLVCVLVTGCVVTGPTMNSPANVAETKPWEVSEEMKLHLKQEYVQFYPDHSCTVEDVQMAVISHTDSDYVLVISCKCGSVNLNASWDELLMDAIADLEFYVPNGWFFTFYKDGEFRTLSEAYNAGWLDYAQLRMVWDDYYAQFPKALERWKQYHAGASQPPKRDPSGLDYEVNADGVTCTITGMGVCNDLEVVIPEYIDGYKVTAIGKMAFWAQMRITRVVMPDSVISIGDSAFKECENLVVVKLSASLERIDTQAFVNCKNLRAITLPGSLRYIGHAAFSKCSSLKEMIIPYGVETIYAGTFSYCQRLQLLVIPSSVTRIEDGAFNACLGLSEIIYRGTKARWEMVEKNDPWYPNSKQWIISCVDGEVTERKA